MTPQSSQFDRDSLVLQQHHLQVLNRAISHQMQIVSDVAEEMGIDPMVLRDAQGNWPMIPLLQAQANTQLALTLLRKELRRA